MQNIIIIGAGAFGHELAEFITTASYSGGTCDRFVGFLDDTKSSSDNSDWKILSTIVDYIPMASDRFLISLGTPIYRERIGSLIASRQGKLASFIHPLANVSKYAKISPGCIVGPYVTLGYESYIGRNVLLNSYAAIGHHTIVGDNSVISPKCLVAGKCRIGESVFMGSASTVIPEIRVGDMAKIAAGSVVFRHVRPGMFAVGNPAKQHQLG